MLSLALSLKGYHYICSFFWLPLKIGNPEDEV